MDRLEDTRCRECSADIRPEDTHVFKGHGPAIDGNYCSVCADNLRVRLGYRDDLKVRE